MSYHLENAPHSAIPTPRNTWLSMVRGAKCRCPACGNGALFTSYLKVVHTCGSCGTELHHQRADDAPPYFTMLIVGHVIVGGVLMLEQAYAPSELTHMLIWIPLTVIMSLVLLPLVKGALVGLQWANRMHGFATGPDIAGPAPLDPSATATPIPPSPASRTTT